MCAFDGWTRRGFAGQIRRGAMLCFFAGARWVFCWLSPGFLKSKAVSPRLLSQADGRDGVQQFCWRKVCKVKICFARFASQTLLASNFCLARQKSPKSRLKERGYSAGITMGQA